MDYIGILLSGRVGYKTEKGTYSLLDMGKIIGGMTLLGMEGTAYHLFDIVGDVDGYVWCLRTD